MHSESINHSTFRPVTAQKGERTRHEDPVRRCDDSKRFRKTMKESKQKGGDKKAKAKAGTEGKSTAETREGQGMCADRVSARGRHKEGEGFGRESRDGSLTAGMFALQQAQLAVHQATVQPTAATSASMAPALADLIAKHVKQLLVPVGNATGDASREVMLTLGNDLLPGTDLWLSRTEGGWKIRADTRSPEAYRFLVEQTPDLVKRFADSHLGELDIDPNLEA